MTNKYTIKTKRLILREIESGDAETIVRWRSDPKVYQYFRSPHALTMEEHLAWFENGYLGNEDIVSWIGSAEGRLIGVFGAKRISFSEAEVSYLVAQKFQNRGYAREAVEGICQWISSNWNVILITAEIHSKNIVSQNFIQALGFSETGGREGYIKYYRKVGSIC